MNSLEILRKNARSIVRDLGFFRKLYENTQATHGESHVLIELKRLGELETGEIARMLNMEKSGASKILKSLKKRGLIQPRKADDARKKPFELTKAGRKLADKIDRVANRKMNDAIGKLGPKERGLLLEGVALLSDALKNARAGRTFKILPCEPRHNAQIASIVKRSLKDLGFAGPGTAATDPTLDYLSSFNGHRTCYLVAEENGRVMGGAGIQSMQGEGHAVCELVRMFLRPEARSSGLAQMLIEKCLAFARKSGYRVCYLETTEKMAAAQRLYLKNGFRYVKRRRGNTGHFACKILMERRLP